MKHVIVIGGGASGMAAALGASQAGHEVTLLEQNEKLGKKVYISGKGRCNLTNAADLETILSQVVTNPKFLYSALYGFTNTDVMKLLNENGCPVKTERGNRVFPVSDHSSDVIRCFERILKAQGVKICLNTKVTGLSVQEDCCDGVYVSGKKLPADAVILATGGFSYQATGSTGDGYRFSEAAGHTVQEPLPALVPFETEEEWPASVSGLSLRNIAITLSGKRGVYYEDFGELLFTHFGVSGPVILSASSITAKRLKREGSLTLSIDLKPALGFDELDARILRDFSQALNKQFKNALNGLLPLNLIPIVIRESGIDENKKVNSITKEERERLIRVLKGLKLKVTGTRGFSEAIVTQGGVSVREIDPSTMQSKLVRNLYFAGEVIDVDALTGGYNLQLCWSTGMLAGRSI